jgi:protein arginine N-methyltransferase 5
MTNKRGFPALSKRHQEFLADCFKRGVQAVLSGNAHHTPPPEPAAAAGGGTAVGLGPEGGAVLTVAGGPNPLRPYWEYLSYLFRWGAGGLLAGVLVRTYSPVRACFVFLG